MQGAIRIDKTGNVKLVVVAKDVQYDSSVAAGTNNYNFHGSTSMVLK
jgi:hypothetical protein